MGMIKKNHPHPWLKRDVDGSFFINLSYKEMGLSFFSG
jgi:hypothetical protein